jgi:hypothetical protein
MGTGPATQDETYFAERLIRHPNGGAIGLIGPTRDSSSWANDVLARGLFDAVWPDAIAEFGGNTTERRLGDILNHAKNYLLTQQGAHEGWEKYWQDEPYLYNVIGDPTLEMWTSQPALQLSSKYQICSQSLDPTLCVKYPVEGATITARQETLQGMAPIGRAKVKNGEAHLEYVVLPEQGLPIQLSVSMENEVSLLLTPRNAEPVDLQDDSSFTFDATRINFDDDGRLPNQHISNQYQYLGVLFVDDTATTPLIVDNYIRLGSTQSPPYSLFNNADTFDPGSAGVPLTMTFPKPVRRVGIYIGNGGVGDNTTTATLTAYDNQGDTIFSVVRSGFGNDVKTFIGLDAGAPSIYQMKLDYGNTLLSEEIDDLMFE